MKKGLRFGLVATALWATVGSTAVFAQKKKHRHHEAHEHGAATMNVAVEGSELRLSLKMPMDNVVGFEHPPRNATEKERLDKALADLRDGSKVLALPAVAKCTLSKADVVSDFDDDDHDDDVRGKKEGKEAKKAAKGHKEHEHEHAEVKGDYVFACAAVGELKAFDVALFKTLAPRLAKVAVTMVTATKQGSVNLSKDKFTVNLP